ncbi:hypothetical protein [Catellatospora coxensis]|uniref:Uncharacterized protein n=1 Tax=Catellatospora coxensis TaxID=310354 RepID=A0A8J3KX02_9ACTN|nr:hypothetical protein [Catellatospora coxensis]GIG07693.1 hypothetical protein Cco03nite_43930 [Catellatospora coxensis]
MSPFLAAALHANGQLPSERLPWIAAGWLAAGHDGPALRELAGLSASDYQEAADLLPAALAETGLAPLTEELGARAFLDHLYTGVLDGRLGEGDLCWKMSDLRNHADAVHGVWPFDELAQLEYEFNVLYGSPTDVQEQIVRRLCQDHRDRYFAGEAIA